MPWRTSEGDPYRGGKTGGAKLRALTSPEEDKDYAEKGRRLRPEMIRDMMRDIGDGTVTVRLYGKVGANNTEMKPVFVRADKIIPQMKNGQVYGGENCLWVIF